MDNVLSAETWLFGEVGQAFYHQNDQYFKVSVRDETPTPCRAQEMNVLYDACMDAPIYLPYVLPPEQLSEKLWEWYEKYSALEFFLDGLDATLDEDLRINCIRDVEETFEENEEAYQFVLQRFLSHPLPKEADIKNAIKYAKTQKVKQLYQEASGEREKSLRENMSSLRNPYEERLRKNSHTRRLTDSLRETSIILAEIEKLAESEQLAKQNNSSTILRLKDYLSQLVTVKKS